MVVGCAGWGVYNCGGGSGMVLGLEGPGSIVCPDCLECHPLSVGQVTLVGLRVGGLCYPSWPIVVCKWFDNR